MERSLTAKRVSTVRRVGWLSVASMLALALLAPAAGTVAAASVTPTNPTGNPTCTDLNPAWTLYFKIDTGDLENRAYAWNEGGDVESNWNGQTITLSSWSAEGQTFDWSSTLLVSGVLVKGGGNNALYTYVPAVTGDTGLTHGPEQQAVSHLLFCGDPTPTTTTTTTTETTTTETTTTETTTTETTTTETTTTETTTTETTTPSQSVLSETGTPSVTLPPTDSLGGTSAPSDGTWRLALIALAVLLASVLVLSPTLATSHRR